MRNPLWHRRRAERFAQLLEEASGGRRHRTRSPHDSELGELVAISRELHQTTPAPEVDEDYRTGLRAMLLATAEREGLGATAASEATTAPEPAPAQARRRAIRPSGTLARGPRARTAAITGLTIGAVAFAGMSTASANAVPGDALYGVKRSTERAQLALAGSDVGRAQLYLDFARTRLEEAATVSGRMERVLGDMDRDTIAGVKLLTSAAANRSDPAALDPITPFVAEQRAALEPLAEQSGDPDVTRVEESLQLLDDISERAAELRRSLELGCQSVTSIDDLGPMPEDCLALPTPGQPTPIAPELGPTRSGQEADAASGATGGEATDRPDAAGNPATTGTDEGTGAGAGSAPSEAAPDPAGEPEPDDGGLLDGLNRLIGNLAGG